MIPHKPGKYTRRKRRQPKVVKIVAKPVRHAARPKARPAPKLRDQTKQFTGQTVIPLRPEPKAKPHGLVITPHMLARAKGSKSQSFALAKKVFALAAPMPGIVPAGKETIAMDSAISDAIGWAANAIYNGAFTQGVAFLGYPYLSELAQRAEYRRVSEVIATEMTREWIEIKCHSKKKPKDDIIAEREAAAQQNGQPPGQPGQQPGQPEPDTDGPVMDFAPPEGQEPGQEGQPPAAMAVPATPLERRVGTLHELLDAVNKTEDERKDERVKELEDEFERLGVRDVFKEAAQNDGFFGRSHIYICLKDDETDLTSPIGTGDEDDLVTEAKLQLGALVRLKSVEPVWTYPANYNTNNPLSENWYSPKLWFVMGKEIHGSRLLTFIGRKVPDMLKPAYSFGGLSLSQMVQPTVMNWLRTRQSVSDIVHAFSVFVLKTNMGQAVQEDGDELFNRVDFFNAMRDNRGMMVVDKDTEEFANISAPLSNLDALQAQSQEHICSVSGLPLVKYTGIAPSGLNATGDSEIRVFYDWIHAYQHALFKENLDTIFHLAQRNIWGRVDPDLYYEFKPLWKLTEKEQAEKEKIEAERDVALVNAGLVSTEEARERMSQDTAGSYAGLDADILPEPPPGEDPMGGREGFDEGGEDDEGGDETGGDETGGEKPPAPKKQPAGAKVSGPSV